MAAVILSRLFAVFVALLGILQVTVTGANEGLELINKARIQNGLPPFTEQKALTKAAKNHAHYMALHQTSAHTEKAGLKGFTGESPMMRAVRAGYSAYKCSENISYGEPSWNQSVENLFAAIYHRLNFLSFNMDEIGFAAEKSPVKSAGEKPRYYYGYMMGNSLFRSMCEATQSRNEGYYGICRDQKLVVGKLQYKHAQSHFLRIGPDLVVYPWPDQKDTLPVFVNRENPDPWPGRYTTGLPVSVQFNPLRFRVKNVAAVDLELTDERGHIIPLLPRRDKASDTHNKKFTEFEYAWFPEHPLNWDMTYKATLQYSVNGKPEQKQWAFTTRKLPGKRVRTITHSVEHFRVKPDVEHIIVLSPNLSDASVVGANLEKCRGEKCALDIWGFNVVTVTQRGQSTLTLTLDNGKTYTVHLSS